MNIFNGIFASLVPAETNVARTESMAAAAEKFSGGVKKFQFNYLLLKVNLVDTSLVNAGSYAFQFFENSYKIIYI